MQVSGHTSGKSRGEALAPSWHPTFANGRVLRCPFLIRRAAYVVASAPNGFWLRLLGGSIWTWTSTDPHCPHIPPMSGGPTGAFPFPLWRYAKGRSCEPTNGVLR